MFFWNSWFFNDPTDVGNLILVPLPFLKPAWTSGSSRFMYCWSLAWRIDQPRQHIKKQRHYFANKGPSSQGCGFPVVMYGWKSWTVKKAERRRIDAFELWCWRRLLRVPWTTRRSNQSILKESVLNIHWKDWCWNSNTLTTRCEELTPWKRSWCCERLKVGGEGDDRGWDG